MDNIEGEDGKPGIPIDNDSNKVNTKSGKKGAASKASGEYIPLATFEEGSQQEHLEQAIVDSSNRSFVIDIPTSSGKGGKKKSLVGDNQPLMSYRGDSSGGRGKFAHQPPTSNEESNDSQISVDMKYSKGPPNNGGGIIGVPSDEEKVGCWGRWFGKRVPQARSFPLNETSQPGFPPNKIRNQKYHAYSFLFVVLFNQVKTILLFMQLIRFSLNIFSTWYFWSSPCLS